MSTNPTKKPTTAKASAGKASASKASADKGSEVTAADGDAPTIVAGMETAGEPGGHLRLKDLVENVIAATGAKPKDVRELVTATLSELAAALERGDALNLPDLGKIRVARRGDDPDGTISMVLKLRKGGPGGPRRKEGQEALAEATE